jgi:hypothetical protein
MLKSNQVIRLGSRPAALGPRKISRRDFRPSEPEINKSFTVNGLRPYRWSKRLTAAVS